MPRDEPAAEVVGATMQEPLAGRQAAPQISDPPGRILVVDDDPAVSDVVRRYLLRDGHAVGCVQDGYEALRRAAEAPPDLVVLDLMLPGMDGLEVCRRLRARWPIPVVMLTARGDETDRLAGFETGADDYVTSLSVRMSWPCACVRCCAGPARAACPASSAPGR
jgi:CheY-like chemotaxis protein